MTGEAHMLQWFIAVHAHEVHDKSMRPARRRASTGSADLQRQNDMSIGEP